MRLALPNGVMMQVDRAETAPDGRLEVPDDVTRAGWWVGSSRLGDAFGSMVVAAHVDSFSQGLGPVAELLSATPGATLQVYGGGLAQTFTVESVTYVPRARLDQRSPLFSVGGELRLVVITCGGQYDAERGYRDNVVVTATPAGSLSGS